MSRGGRGGPASSSVRTVGAGRAAAAGRRSGARMRALGARFPPRPSPHAPRPPPPSLPRSPRAPLGGGGRSGPSAASPLHPSVAPPLPSSGPNSAGRRGPGLHMPASALGLPPHPESTSCELPGRAAAFPWRARRLPVPRLPLPSLLHFTTDGGLGVDPSGPLESSPSEARDLPYCEAPSRLCTLEATSPSALSLPGPSVPHQPG